MPNPPDITVLLALYNGAAFLGEQIDSIINQTLPPTTLIISDDGSTDGSLEIAEQKALQYPNVKFEILHGPRQGYAANFFSLLAAVHEHADYVALSDQDDVWLKDKLERAVHMIPNQTTPVLYGSCVWVVDTHLQNKSSTRQLRVPPSFKHALTQNFAPGNSMVLNPAALRLMQTAIGKIDHVPVHDWWVYQMISGAGGTIIHDPKPQVLYRQHNSNAIGANTGVSAVSRRIWAMLRGDFRSWNDANFAALAAVKNHLSPTAAQTLTDTMSARHLPFFQRIRQFRKIGLIRQGRAGKISLWIAIALKRI